jgi:hypothetical protein
MRRRIGSEHLDIDDKVGSLVEGTVSRGGSVEVDRLVVQQVRIDEGWSSDATEDRRLVRLALEAVAAAVDLTQHDDLINADSYRDDPVPPEVRAFTPWWESDATR